MIADFVTYENTVNLLHSFVLLWPEVEVSSTIEACYGVSASVYRMEYAVPRYSSRSRLYSYCNFQLT